MQSKGHPFPNTQKQFSNETYLRLPLVERRFAGVEGGERLFIDCQ